MRRWDEIARGELDGFHLKLAIAQLLVAPLPAHVGSLFRAYVFRMAGFHIGRGTVFWGTPTFTGSGDLYGRLQIGTDCWINVGCFFDLNDEITIGDRVSIGQQVMVMTSAHKIGNTERRAGPITSQPVRIENGAWLSTRCTILPGVTIGEGAVVAAGAVVTKSVAANQLVGGIPARIIREL